MILISVARNFWFFFFFFSSRRRHTRFDCDWSSDVCSSDLTEQGIKEAMERGILAGYPITGVRAILYDGSYHDVDSSEINRKSTRLNSSHSQTSYAVFCMKKKTTQPSRRRCTPSPRPSSRLG